MGKFNESTVGAEAAHSRIGASSMHRWSICPGSVKLSEGIESKSSVYAAEGTLAHDYASKILLGTITPLELKDIIAEMKEAIDVYVQAVQETAAADKNSVVFIEQRLDLSSIHPGLFGTGDAIVWLPGTKTLQVFDYKHGAGIPVDVENNEQLMYYGLGALLHTGFPASKVVLNIVQPRCNHSNGPIRSWEFDSFDLIEFAADLKEFAEATEKEDAPLVPGEHCRFCPAAAYKCPKIKELANETAKLEFTPSNSPTISYDPAKLKQALDAIPAIQAWVKSVDEFAYSEANAGREIPGYKLVEKRASRKWRDEASVLAMAETDFPELIEKSVKSVAQAEKTIGKKEFAAEWEELVIKESTGLTLVPDTDKRPKAQKLTAQEEFNRIDNQGE